MYSIEAIKEAFDNVIRMLSFPLNEALQKKYQNGLIPKLLSHDLVETPEESIPALQKYLIGVATCLAQPCTYYDIFRACRHVTFIQILNLALQSLKTHNVANLESRLERLKSETELDKFDSILFELACAASYAVSPDVAFVEFIPEAPPLKTPDFFAVSRGTKYYVECKKLNRITEMNMNVRNHVNQIAAPFIKFLQEKDYSAVVEVNFNCDPKDLDEEIFLSNAKKSLSYSAGFYSDKVTINTKMLRKRRLSNNQLFPSPQYYFERYGFTVRDEWMGLIHFLIAQFAFQNGDSSEVRRSSWLEDVTWECAIKWKITNEQLTWRYRRLAYSTIFKGLEQLKASSKHSILHCWFEREPSLGNRQRELLDFLNRLKVNQKDEFSYIILNETIMDVTPKGSFDFVEHAHRISGPTAKQLEPIVSGVFLGETIPGIGEFGIGQIVPEID